ncbi:MAG TPA: sodium:solute symporter family protein [Lacipirellulaceae bacterium]|nr:sodium:solute symporter family protein [Lacipirellulaceae bacterium]
MTIHSVDLAVLLVYFAVTILVGLWVSKRGAKDLDSYFLGSKSLPWYVLGISDASGMFDIAGTMVMVYWLFVYGLKSIWLPFLWPVFNQIFLMMFLSAWLRRSNVLTGAEWIQFRFGRGTGANLAHISVVIFALVNTVGLLAYAFKGIGKFAVTMVPWQLSTQTAGPFTNENVYAMIILALTSLYAIKGGMVSVVATEVMQFTILTTTSLIIGVIAMAKVAPDMVAHAIPSGWIDPFFGWKINLDWSSILPKVNNAITKDGNDWFGIVFGLMFFKGILASLAGPAPNYDMQRVLATRNPREACLMNGMVNVVLYFPRYMMIAGISVLALAFWMPELRAMDKPDFERLLPMVLTRDVPQGVVGLLLAGLLAAFMSNFAATINAAPAYIVNDIYKRFINANTSPKAEVAMSRAASLAVLIVGIVFGLLTRNIIEVMMWIVAALYGGYVVANVLKWYWWRFNGYGYFWGMVAGILGAMLVPELMPFVAPRVFSPQLAAVVESNQLYTIPVLVILSLGGCLLGTYLSDPEDAAILKNFYKTTRPWGFWGPIRDLVVAEDPSFQPNRNAARDCTNVAVGIVWQLCLTSLPIFLVLRSWNQVVVVSLLLILTSIFIKLNWYDKLPRDESTATITQLP